MSKPPVTDLDEWYHHVLGSMTDYSLIKDEMISEERGQKNVFRRNHKGRSSSPKGVRLKLETISRGSDYHHGEVPIQERRQIFSGILVDRETSSLEIEKYIRERDTLHEVHQEIWAALLFTAGPEKFANLTLDLTTGRRTGLNYEERLEEGFIWALAQDYENCRHNVPKQKFAFPVDYWPGTEWPIATLLCNLEEAKTVVATFLRRTNQWLEKLSSVDIDSLINSWKQSGGPCRCDDDDLLVKSIEATERICDGEEPCTVEIQLRFEICAKPLLGLFFKFPELFEVASNLGWEPVQSNLLDELLDFEEPDVDDEDEFNFDYTWSLRREIN